MGKYISWINLSGCDVIVCKYLEVNVLEQIEVLSIEFEVLHDQSVVHVVWVMIRHREITIAHHLFRGVHCERTINAATFCLRFFL